MCPSDGPVGGEELTGGQTQRSDPSLWGREEGKAGAPLGGSRERGDSWSVSLCEGEGKVVRGREQSVWVPELPEDWREVCVALMWRPRWVGARGSGRQVPRDAEGLASNPESGERAACMGWEGARPGGCSGQGHRLKSTSVTFTL